MDYKLIDGKSEALNYYDISDYHVVDALFLRSVIIDYDIQFNEDLHLREDDVFMGKFYALCSKVIQTNLPLYRYVRSSNFSSTHNLSVERERLLIQSGLKAIRYRSEFIKNHCNGKEFPLEKYKYMRWVCNGKLANAANYSYSEYLNLLNQFKGLGAYPISYKMIKIGRFDGNIKSKLKWFIKVSLFNMPFIDYYLHKYFKK